MFDAALMMSGDIISVKSKCIVDYSVKQHEHVITTMCYDTGDLSKLHLSNLLFDSGFNFNDVSDTSVKQRENSCWSLEFGIHSKDVPANILTWKKVTFVDHRLWVADNKTIKGTKWQHPFTEMANGEFNARSGLCSHSMDFFRHLIVVGSDFGVDKFYNIHKINKHGFMQVETDNGLFVQHLNNFDVVEPGLIRGVWFNDSTNAYMFEDSADINTMQDECVYLLLDTHSRSPRYLAKDEKGPVYVYDYTKAKAFFSETEAMSFAKKASNRYHSTFTVDQWI